VGDDGELRQLGDSGFDLFLRGVPALVVLWVGNHEVTAVVANLERVKVLRIGIFFV
jgi:hypothetical protein